MTSSRETKSVMSNGVRTSNLYEEQESWDFTGPKQTLSRKTERPKRKRLARLPPLFPSCCVDEKAQVNPGMKPEQKYRLFLAHVQERLTRGKKYL
jgi:hypothetical protein